MGTVIYSASPLQAFLGSAGTILFLILLGIVAIGAAFFRRNQGRGPRLLLGGAGLVLLIAGCGFAAVTAASVSSGTQTVAVNLDNKRIVEDNCGDNGQTCSRYVLEATTSTTAYDFNVPADAYDKAQVNTCYKFTYYPNKGLFSSETAAYQQINNVIRIETADPSSCQ